MKTRYKARQITLQILYQYDPPSFASADKTSEPHELINGLRFHYDHFKVSEEIREFIGQLVAGTLAHLAKIDALVEKHATHWKIARMTPVDRNLLRMATFELMFLKDTPPQVVMHEVIELAKQFGTAESPTFINGVLDNISKVISETSSEELNNAPLETAAKNSEPSTEAQANEETEVPSESDWENE